MSAVRDVNMLPSLLNFDPVVVNRLRRMRYIRRVKPPVNIFRRWDNCLRSEMDGLFCLRRNKYVTRLGLYYWNHLRDKNCEECGRLQEPEWHSHEHPYIVMMKAAPVVGGGLDFARVAIGLGLELACFGSFLTTESKGASSKNDDSAAEGASRGDCSNTRDRAVHSAPLDLSLRDYNLDMADDQFMNAEEPLLRIECDNFAPDDNHRSHDMSHQHHHRQHPYVDYEYDNAPRVAAASAPAPAKKASVKLSSNKSVGRTSRLRAVIANQATRKNRIMLSA